MAEAQLETHVRLLSGVAILDLRGDITAFAEASLKAAYLQAEEAQPRAIALNLGQVNYINSTGIALIVSLLGRARQARCPVLAFGLSDHYREIFELTRLSDFMQLVPDEAAALRAVPKEENP